MSEAGTGGAQSPAGVIHDLGYRGYNGATMSNGAIMWALFLQGLGAAYGLGRSGRAKVLPFTLLAFYLFQAIVVVGILSFGLLNELPTPLHGYAVGNLVLISIFVATQATVIFGRDLRYRSMVLYLARPLSSGLVALTRWCSMAAATLLFLLAPVALMYIGALLSGLDPEPLGRQLLVTLPILVLLAAGLASVSGVISSWTLRPGLAIIASIAVLMLGAGLVALTQAIAPDAGAPIAGQVAGLFSPYYATAGVGHLMDSDVSVLLAPEGAGMAALYVAVTVLGPVLGIWLIARRFAKGAA